MWECVGGSVVKGEDSLLGAIREAREEVGVDLIPENGQIDLGNAATDEVAQVAWMNRGQIEELFDENMFVNTLEYFCTEVDKLK